MKIDKNKIVIVPKLSKYEWDMKRLSLSHEEVLDLYKRYKLDVQKILESHERQKAGLAKLKEFFSEKQFVARDDFTKRAGSDAELVLSYGGDNQFQYVAHFIDDTPILGINSDSVLSDGALTSLTVDKIDDLMKKIESDELKIEEWPRLEITIDDKKLDILAVSEIFIGELNRMDMSRHLVSFNGKSERQKGSGILVSTGAGSTGWYDSACRYFFPEGDIFPRTNKEARFILTEPFKGKFSSYELLNGRIEGDQELQIQSLNDSQGVLTIDSIDRFKLEEGAKIKLKFGKPLRIVRVS